jgi:hypothetical protein
LFHINILKAVLSDAAKQNGIMAEATRISAGATDEAIQKNEELRKTMSAVATETGLAIKQVSAQIGEIALAPGMEKILNTVKSLAEGLSGVLGDGESTGSSFATGFLKGIGNVITGPGLVVLAGVFFKLFGQALKFTKESLTSLVGVTTEKQKQKAIQTSLVALFGQNAALNKEMLRTDIGRTEKEKIILGLLKAQVVEANALNKLTAGMAGTLYRKGYGANLTPVGKKASGHIPNFANPERAQAAQGGYAAGSIRTMNMPGEGPVIYNSAETVKNFAGFKQPAIMPPQSSKAGKNYQQAFGDIHGFDPYAAGGYIPNYAKMGKGVGPRPRIDLSNPAIMQEIDKKTKYLNAGSSKYIGLSASLGPDKPKQTFYVAGGSGTDSGIFNQKGRSFYKKAAMQKAQPRKIDVEFKSLDEKDERRGFQRYDDEINSKLQKRSAIIASGILKTFGYGSMNSAAIEKDLPKSKMATVAGHIFEAVTKSVLRSVGAEAAIPDKENELIDLLPNKELYKLFDVDKGKGSSGAEAKINTNLKNVMGFARKIYSSDPTTKTPLDLKSLPKKGKAYGHIPNFADPLSDAIGREKAAGIPVSQIRVGSHGALMNKSNPLGLGVTNTHDEPNGLRDVFGAHGFVPNYVDPVRIGSSDFNSPFSSMMGDQVKRFNKIMARFTRQFEQGEINFKELQARTQRLGSKMNLHSNSIETLISKQSTSIGTIDKLNAKRRGLMNSLSRQNQKFASTSAGKAFASSGGQMALMMGLPMAGGFISDTVGGTAGRAIGGAMTGAATGASMGMMFGPLGTAIGTTIGAFGGLVSALKEAKEAEKEKVAEQKKASLAYTAGVASGGLQVMQSVQGMPEYSNEDIYNSIKQNIRANIESMTVPHMVADRAGKGVSSRITQRPAFQQLGAANLLPNFPSEVMKKMDDAEMQRLTKQHVIGLARPQVEMQAFQQRVLGLPEDKTFFTEEILSKEEREKMSKKGISPTKRLYSPKQYVEALGNLGPEEQAQYLEQIKKLYKEHVDLTTKQNEGVILQLNVQRAMLNAQQQARLNQLDINNSFSEVASSLDLQSKIMGNFATEQQKAQENYVKSINKATEKYALSAGGGEETFRGGLLSFVKDPNVGSKLKTALAKEELQKEKKGFPKEFASPTKQEIEDRVRILDLTKKLSKLSNEELETKLRSLGLNPTEIQQINDLKAARDGNLQLALKELTTSRERLTAEFKINDAIAKRKDLISDMKTSAGIGAETVGSAGRIRAMDAQVAAAERLGGVGPGYQTSADQEAFQMQEKRIALQNKSLEIQDQAKQKMNEELIKLADLKMQDAELIKLKEKGINLSPQEHANLLALEATSEKRKQQQNEIVGSVERINKEAKKEISTAEKLLALEEKRLTAKRAHETGPGAFRNGMSDTAKSMREQVEYMDYELGKRIPTAFADGLATAMTDAINGTKSIKEGLMDAAISFLGMIQQAMMQKMAYQMVGAMGFSRGGNVRNYSRGGGVPAMVSNGEYVMGRDAVAKYGGSFMHGMNAGGRIPGFAGGGSVEQDLLARGKIRREGAPGGPAAQGSALAANFGGGRGFDSGRLYQRRAMSGAFYAQSGNVGLAEDTSAIQSILSEEERIRQEAEAKRQAKKAKRRQLLGMVLGTVASYGLGKIFSGGSGSGLFSPKPTGTGTVLKTPSAGWGSIAQGSDLVSDIAGGGGGFNPGAMDKIFNIDSRLGPWKPNYYGGSIRKYASGGHIAGKSGIDQIPAMLSEGEYVIRASSARQIGRPMLDRINAGKFNDGGAVSEIAGSSETGSTGGNTNNINISINMERGKAQQSNQDSGGQNSADRSNDEQSSAALADRIKQQVVAVIVEEQRPGGLLDEKS